jgi:hypothetical protein
MSNKKQTAVEFLEQQIIRFHNWKLSPIYDENCVDEIELDKFIKQAKAMEKEQIIDFHIEIMKEGLLHEGERKWDEGYLPKIKKQAEQYYNKTYGGDTIQNIMSNKKETLEEAAERLYQKGLKDDLSLSFYDGVKFCAKWQAERMYTEEEFEKAVSDAYVMGRKNLLMGVFNKWFEQFKK